MEKELFPMIRGKERRIIDGTLNSKSSKNRRKGDKIEDNTLVKLMEHVYVSHGIIFIDSLERISSKIELDSYSGLVYDKLIGKEKNYIIQKGTFVIILKNLDFFEHGAFDNSKLQEVIANLEKSEMKLLLHNGSWWVRQNQSLNDIKYKNVLEENNYLEDLKELY